MQGRVNGIMRQVEKERPALVGLNEIQCLICEPVGEVFARRTIGKFRITIGDKIALRGRACAVAADIDVEALTSGTELRVITKMPLTDTGADVASRLDSLSNGYNLRIKNCGIGYRDKFP